LKTHESSQDSTDSLLLSQIKNKNEDNFNLETIKETSAEKLISSKNLPKKAQTLRMNNKIFENDSPEMARSTRGGITSSKFKSFHQNFKNKSKKK